MKSDSVENGEACWGGDRVVRGDFLKLMEKTEKRR